MFLRRQIFKSNKRLDIGGIGWTYHAEQITDSHIMFSWYAFLPNEFHFNFAQASHPLPFHRLKSHGFSTLIAINQLVYHRPNLTCLRQFRTGWSRSFRTTKFVVDRCLLPKQWLFADKARQTGPIKQGLSNSNDNYDATLKGRLINNIIIRIQSVLLHTTSDKRPSSWPLLVVKRISKKFQLRHTLSRSLFSSWSYKPVAALCQEGPVRAPRVRCVCKQTASSLTNREQPEQSGFSDSPGEECLELEWFSTCYPVNLPLRRRRPARLTIKI